MISQDHEHDLERLAAHLEDRLDTPEKERLTRHLADCAECRETLAGLARAGDLLPRPANAPPRPAWGRRAAVWLPLAASLIVAVATLGRFDRKPPPGAPRPVPARVSPGLAAPADQVPVPTPPPLASPVPRTLPGASAPPPEVLRGAQRRVAGKSLRLVFGEWVDADFDPSALLPEVTVSTAAERSALLARIPALAPLAAVGRRVVVVHEGTVYRFRPDPLD